MDLGRQKLLEPTAHRAPRLGEQGLELLAPYKSKKGEKEPWPR